MDERGQGSQLYALVVGVVLLTSMALVGVLVFFFGGAVLVPMFDEIVATSSGAQDEGFVDPAYNVLQVGMGISMVLLIASPIVYFLFLRLRSDTTPRR